MNIIINITFKHTCSSKIYTMYNVNLNNVATAPKMLSLETAVKREKDLNSLLRALGKQTSRMPVSPRHATPLFRHKAKGGSP